MLIIGILAGVSFVISHSLSAGILIGLISFLLVRIFIFTLVRSGITKKSLLIPFFNLLKFGVIVLLLFVCIRQFKFDALLLAIGYSISFLLTITEISIMKPKEL